MVDTTRPFRDVLPLPSGASRPSGTLPLVLPEPSPAPAEAPDARRLGDLELLGELARGGMGVVYRALDRRLGREVAVKVALGGAADPEELERFAVEARAAARLRHPNIVGIHRVGEERGAPYLVMDLVPGESLQRRLSRDGPLRPREAARLCALLARALAFAHGRGVLHRDLKPHNVLVTPDGQPVLTDFGLAKEVDRARGVTMTGQVLGTPAYMAPEQARGDNERVDRRADVYGLGATLYALLTGQPPFQAGSAIAVLAKVAEDPVEPPRRCAPRSTATWRRSSSSAWRRSRARATTGRRTSPTTWSATSQASRSAPGAPGRARAGGRWVRRHRLASAGVAGALALALAAGFGARAAEHERLPGRGPRRRRGRRAALEADADAPLDRRLGLALVRLQAAQRWSDLARRPEARRAQADAAFALADVATDGQQWALAEQAYALSGLGPDDPRRARALAALNERRVRMPREVLEDLERGAREGRAFTDPSEAVLLLVRAPDAVTVALLADRLRAEVDALKQARRAALVEAERPTAEEVRLGWATLEGLPEAIARLEGDDAVPRDAAMEAARRLVHEAALRVGIRASGHTVSGAAALARGWSAVAAAQAAALGEPRRRVVAACVTGLGRLGGAAREAAAGALSAYVRADLDDAGLRRGVVALDQLGVDGARLLHLVETRVGPAKLPLDALRGRGEADSLEEWRRRAGSLAARSDPAALDALDAALARWPEDPELLHLRAVVHLDRGAVRQAEADLERALSRRRMVGSVALSAWLAARRGALEEARAALAEAERLAQGDAGDPHAWTTLARARLALGDPQGARAAATRAIDLDPGSVGALQALAEALVALGDLVAARQAIDDALQLEPAHVQGLLARARIRAGQGELPAALADLERARELAPALPAQRELRAALLLQGGRVDEAAQVARELLPASPGMARWVLAQLALQARRFDDAEAQARAGLEVPALGLELRGVLLATLAEAQLKLGRPRDGLRTTERLLELRPDDPGALLQRASARALLGDVAAALADLDRAVALAPAQPRGWYVRGALRAGRGELEAATRDLEQALRLDPTMVLAHRHLAWIAQQRQDLDAAARHLDQAVALAADEPDTRLARAEVRAQRGDLAGARTDLDHALSLDAGLAAAWAARALVREGQDDPSGALADAERGLALGPRDPEALELLASFFLRRGQGARVMPLVEAALRAGPAEADRERLERVAAALR
ncbi:MAG: protein kinase [Planctomycetes bacterium]|nr:protein kinase [Planctomycetota bacterium]